MAQYIEGLSGAASVIISIALMLFLGFLSTRITKRLHLPSVTGYILTGIIIGPYCCNLIPTDIVKGLDFLSDIALAFIAFSVGEFFKISTLKKNGPRVLIITAAEALTASFFVFILTYFILNLGLGFSIIFAALASATTPASTIMTIRQTGAKGDFVDTLLQVVAIDNVLSLIAYSVAVSVAFTTISSAAVLSFKDILEPIITNVFAMALGAGFAFLMKLSMPKKRSTDNRLIISVSMLFAFCGICALLDVSPLLGCLMMGTVYINITEDDKLFKQLNYFSPPILLLFFVRSGLNFNLGAMFDFSASSTGIPLLIVGICYFAVRIIGKYAGAFLGCAVTRKDKKVRNHLGLALIPQASVAIGLASLAARTIGGKMGSDLETIILAASILCEIVGPAAAALSLKLSDSYSDKLEEITEIEETGPDGEKLSDAEILVRRIQAIQKEIPPHSLYEEEEDAFNEAAEELYLSPNQRISNFRNRR